MKHILVFILMSCSAAALSAQTLFKVTATITNADGSAAIGAAAKLLNEDSLTVTATFSDENGVLSLLQVPSGAYTLQVSSFGMHDISQRIFITDQDLHLGTIKMQQGGEQLENIIITGLANGVVQKDDTTQYNANSYKTNLNATAEDLLRKMPGMDLSNGQTKAQGEQVAKVLVDGKPFFGDDAKTTLRSLPAEIVGAIQVYDEKSEQSQRSGFDDGETIKTINIVTKQDKKQGTFGKAYLGGGLPDYYQAGLSLNSFKNEQRITLLGMANNINIQNFGSGDLQGIGSGGRGRGRGRGGNSDFTVDQQGGINISNAGGLNYSNVIENKLKISGSYFVNETRNNAIQNIQRSYVGNDQVYEENSNSNSQTLTHKLAARMEYEIDSSNYLMLAPSLQIMHSKGSSLLNGTTKDAAGSILSTTSNQYNTTYNTLAGGYRVYYNHKFANKRRSISLFSKGDQNINDGNNHLDAMNVYEDTSTSYMVNQNGSLKENSFSTYTNLNYTEPLGDKWALQAKLGLGTTTANGSKRTYQYENATEGYTMLDTLLSSDLKSHYSTPSAGLAIGYTDSNFSTNVGVSYQNARLSTEQLLPTATNINRDFNNLLIRGFATYTFSKSKSWRMYFGTSTNAPTVQQLQEVVDNSNTLILQSGNANLKQDYQYRLYTNYRSSNSERGSSFFTSIWARYTQNYIANSTTLALSETTIRPGVVLLPGQQFVLPVNLDGYYNVNSHSTYGMPLKSIKSNLNISADLSANRSPGLLNGELNYANNYATGAGISVSSNISEQLDFNIGTTGSYSFVKNTLNTRGDNNFYSQISRLDLNWIFYKGFFINTILSHQLYTGLGADRNQNFLLWNMSMGKNFGKKDQAELRISVFDLLNQNQTVSRTFTDAYTQDLSTNVLKQYFMLTFTYNIRAFKGDSSERDFRKLDDARREG